MQTSFYMTFLIYFLYGLLFIAAHFILKCPRVSVKMKAVKDYFIYSTLLRFMFQSYM